MGGQRLIVTRQLLVSALLAALLSAIAAGAAGSAATRAPSKSIATATTTDFRVTLQAHRTSGGRAPTAAVELATFERVHSRWQQSGVHEVGRSFFWQTVTGPRALCRLELVTAGRSSPPHVIVRLLVSPALGCGTAKRYPLSSHR